jgi:formate hydrogenlyase subunit 6/NADH:ubiquinone oxidoreductase subunit I
MLPPLVRNLLRNLVSRPVTRLYPAERRAPIAGTRGALENEIEKCVFCGLCQKRCPAEALAVTRKPNSWTLQPYACILCGYCVEVCPRKCLFFRAEHRAPSARA